MRALGEHDGVLAPGVPFEGRYEIVARLGEGGSGTVHEARQLGTGQRVALKLLHGLGGGAAQDCTRVARFLFEARLCARLRHPSIVRLVDSGQTAGGTPYLAFELVPGDTLATLLAAEGALAPREARHLMLQVLDALACAHAEGVVHRDLKPGNIMVTPAGARRDALVLDFGIGALLDDERAARPADSHDPPGTPGYAAPEQWRGGEVSPRADLFSWGLVLLECLTGTPVYAGAPAEILYRLLGPDPVPIPPALARHPLGELIARAVRKDAAARDVTARELRDAVHACDLRGLARGVETHEIGTPRGDAGWPVPEAARLPLSGRAPELAALLERWRRASGGAGQSILVTGEPGIGKSRLARELRARLAHEDHVFLEARCSPDTQHSALSAVIDLLERALELDQALDAGDKIARLERQLARHGLATAEVMPLFLPLWSLPLGARYAPLEVSPPRRKALTLQAITSLLRAMADRCPVLLLAEDLHWVDATTLELLSQLVREAPEIRLCLVMTARPDPAPPFSTASVLPIPLRRLERPHIAEMLGALVGPKPLPAAAIEHVADRADGVPLFVEELFRMMIDAELLVEREDRYELTRPPADAAIPGTLRALLAARLDRLAGAKETAQLAAALGREFNLEVLAAASERSPDRVAEDLDRLMGAGLVLRKRRGKEGLGLFKHALVRDAAYESLSAAARRQAHARIAGALEARFPELARTRPDLLAHHHAAAEQKRQAIGFAQQAAELGLQRSAYVEAIAHASHAIEWAEALPKAEAVEAELTANGALIQAQMATLGWGHPQVKAAAERSAGLLERLEPDSKHRVPTLWFLFTYHHVACNRRPARAAAEQLVEIAERSGDRGLRVAAAPLHGLALMMDCQHADARRVFERAVELYDPDLHRDHGARFGLDSLVLSRAYLSRLHWLSGDATSAFALAASAVAWAREVGHVPSLAIGLLYGCIVHQLAGDRRAVAVMAGEIVALSEKYGLPAYEGYAATLHGWAIGDTQRAHTIVAGLSALGCKLGLSYYASLAADGQAERGELEAAIACIDHCLSLCRQHDEHHYEPELHRRRALYEARRDPAAPGVRASLEQAAELAWRQDMPRSEAQATLELLRRFGRVAHHAARLDELFSVHPGLRTIGIDHHEGGV